MQRLKEFWVEGYRSLRKVRIELDDITVIQGENGAGKTNVYRALRLLSAASSGRLLAELASEGGMPSIAWAGDRKRGPVRLKVGAAFDDLSVEFELGFIPPVPGGSAFDLDPDVKKEVIWPTTATQRSWVFKRESAAVALRDDEGKKGVWPRTLGSWEVALSEVRNNDVAPELTVVRHRLLDWRFYHQFRTDFDAPIRQPKIIFRSPVLEEDGSNLAAAMQTIAEIGDADALNRAIADLTHGGFWQLDVVGNRRSIALAIPGLNRALSAQELSDGQLRFLCLATALLSPRMPQLIVLNEPETSLYDELMPALAWLILNASKDCQIVLTTHSDRLVEELGEGCRRLWLSKQSGETTVV